MSMLNKLLDRIAHDPDCAIFPAVGQPVADAGHTVPEDVRTFYDWCGGLTIGRGIEGEIRIVGPHECVLANDVILVDLGLAERAREELRGHPSWDWYIVADLWGGNYLVCDFGDAHNGRCYEADWSEYPGRMPIVSVSFHTLIENLYEHMERGWYWLEPEFWALGDAYDAT